MISQLTLHNHDKPVQVCMINHACNVIGSQTSCEVQEDEIHLVIIEWRFVISIIFKLRNILFLLPINSQFVTSPCQEILDDCSSSILILFGNAGLILLERIPLRHGFRSVVRCNHFHRGIFILILLRQLCTNSPVKTYVNEYDRRFTEDCLECNIDEQVPHQMSGKCSGSHTIKPTVLPH